MDLATDLTSEPPLFEIIDILIQLFALLLKNESIGMTVKLFIR